MLESKTLVILGAAGATGRHAVAQAVDRGHTVIAVERDWTDLPEPPAGVRKVSADVLRDDLGAVMQGADAVISALGLGVSAKTLLSPPPLYTEGTLRIISGMRAAGLIRLVVVSASFVGDRNRGPVWFRNTTGVALDRIFGQMAEMERILSATEDIAWTALRPGWLMEGPATRDYVVTEDVIPETLIRTRHADLADLALVCVEEGNWIRQKPAIAREEPASASGPGAVLRDVFE
ncbi:NAD(P)H-binding protein [Tranquillimonas rosea]|uniref:NAD(P)H-binding protein n=1 Tax=Tranquillimonas rosea TaxID=641238 RepID=UPI003BAC6523